MNIVYNVCFIIVGCWLTLKLVVIDENQKKAILIKYLKDRRLKKILQQESPERFYFKYRGILFPHDNAPILNTFFSITDENLQLKKLSRRAKLNAIGYYFEVFKKRNLKRQRKYNKNCQAEVHQYKKSLSN